MLFHNMMPQKLTRTRMKVRMTELDDTWNLKLQFLQVLYLTPILVGVLVKPVFILLQGDEGRKNRHATFKDEDGKAKWLKRIKRFVEEEEYSDLSVGLFLLAKVSMLVGAHG